MIDQLKGIPCRIGTVEASRSITVRFWRLQYFDAVAYEMRMPSVNLIRRTDNKTDVVEPLRP